MSTSEDDLLDKLVTAHEKDVHTRQKAVEEILRIGIRHGYEAGIRGGKFPEMDITWEGSTPKISTKR